MGARAETAGAVGVAAAGPLHGPGLGKDEMNLAEFPIALLADRVPAGQKAVEYRDRIFDQKSGRPIDRKLTISASEAHGLPTAVDDDVILALIQLTKTANGFASREVEFSRLDLIKLLGWPDSGFSYKRLATSLKRWLGVTLVYENAWWDRKQQCWTTRGFHIIDDFELNDGRSAAGESKITWNRVVFESFQAGYLKAIDYGFYLALKHPTARRLYRFLSKRMYHRPDWTFDLHDLAFEHVGLSRGYATNAGKVKEKLRPGIQELEAAGFLEPLPDADRYSKDGKAWKVRLACRVAPEARAVEVEAREATPADHGLVGELTRRGVSGSKAVDLVDAYPEARIRRKLEALDWMAAARDRRVARSPAGYLVKSIEDDYADPHGFVPAEVKGRRAEARERGKAAEAEDRRRLARERARDAAEHEQVARFWDALPPAERSRLESEAIASAPAPLLESYRGARGTPLEAMALRLIREDYARRALGLAEASAA